MTCAELTGWSSARSSSATRVIQRASGSSSVLVNRWWYQPGESMPAPYPVCWESLRCVQGTQVISVFTFLGSSASSARSCATVGMVCSAGTCQAPQTTAIRSYPARRAARICWRMYASRSSSRRLSPPCSRRAVIASATASKGARASAPASVSGVRCSTTSSHQRSASSCPAASARAPIGSVGAALPAGSSTATRDWDAGRSMKRTGTSRSTAYRIATHSGEKAANGQNAAFAGSSTTWASRATGGTMSFSPASAAIPSASGGPSINTVSGRSCASAAATARAEPGPWCRTPSRVTSALMATLPSQLRLSQREFSRAAR